jgi:manganese/zinc/iron transport system permease protein
MTITEIELQLIASVVAVACALPGTFLVLRRMAMMSDAISHVVLLGIVLGFFVTQDLGSPFLILAAALTGVLTVTLVELLNRTRLVKEDAAIGLVFPLLFSLAVILVSRYAGNVHLDTDAVLLGELAFAPFDRMVLFGYDLMPRSLFIMGIILLISIAFIVILYKELKLATFDAGLAAALGFAPGMIHYGLMSLVSVTAVGSFDAVGSVLVVAFMIAPPATAYLLTDRLPVMLGLGALFGVMSAIAGFHLAILFDANIAGAMATVAGVIFGLAYLFAPQRGIVAQAVHRRQQRREFAQAMLAIHLLHHEALPEATHESEIKHLHEELRWETDFANMIVGDAVRAGIVLRRNGHLELTDRGRELAKREMVQ